MLAIRLMVVRFVALLKESTVDWLLVSATERVNSVRFVQPANESPPMAFRLLGRLIEVREPQEAKALASIVWRFDGN